MGGGENGRGTAKEEEKVRSPVRRVTNQWESLGSKRGKGKSTGRTERCKWKKQRIREVRKNMEVDESSQKPKSNGKREKKNMKLQMRKEKKLN